LGCAVTTTKREPVNQPDAYVEERKKKILSQMAAPVMRKTLDYDTKTSSYGEEASRRDPENCEASETQRALEQQSKVYIPPDTTEERDSYDWYVLPPSLLPTGFNWSQT
jgi:hypothetical protein